jgi:hypothetical protein
MNHTKISKILTVLFAAVLCFGPIGLAEPLGTAFTYQGRLIDANKAADGLYDFQFKLFDGEADGNQLNSDVNTPDVDVIDGYFTVELDFGQVFDGNACWLDIGVRPGDMNDPNVYTALSPRQAITPAPYAFYALGGGGGSSLWQVNGTSIYYNNGNVGIGTMSPEKKLDIASEGYTGLGICLTNNSPGGTSWDIDNDGGVFKIVEHAGCGPEFINNTRIAVVGNCIGSPYGGNVGIGTSSPAAKLDVSGDISAASVYKIGGSTVLSVQGTGNTLVGVGAGTNNTGNYNTFSGSLAGLYNTTGYSNTFSGYRAGYSNTTGSYNTFSGTMAGRFNTIGNYNTFSGNQAGYFNTEGNYNTFSGYQTGCSNTTGIGNTFSGFRAGISNTTGNYNIFIGNDTGSNNTTGSGNVFIGNGAGYTEPNSISNRLCIANSGGIPLICGDFSTGRVGIATTSPIETLDVGGTVRVGNLPVSSGTTVVADGNGKLCKSSSSRRYKTNIETLDTGADAVLKLRPVRFEYKESGQKDIGLIAEEVEKISPDLVIYDGQGRPDAVKYDKVALYLLSVVKNQQKENEDIKNRLAAMESLVTKLSLKQEGDIK